VEPELARSLTSLYGDEAKRVLVLARETGLKDRIHPSHPYIGAEVAYAVRREMAARVSDVLLRRLPLGLLDMVHAQEAAPVVADIMARELGWDEARRNEEIESARALLASWFTGQMAGKSE